MRRTILLLLMLAPILTMAQHLTYAEWQWKAELDMRLKPRYGGQQKNAEQLASDGDFIAQTLAVEPDKRKASERLVQHGFQLLREGNLMHAMYRFNQGYMLDPKNPEVFRGYGAFFMALDHTADAGREYSNGLDIDSTYVPLMVDLSAAFLAEQHQFENTYPEKAELLLNAATTLLGRALRLDPTNAEAAFKLSVCNVAKGDCAEARKYKEQAKELGSMSVTPEFEMQLKAACP